jgi:GAF domain-containing protein
LSPLPESARLETAGISTLSAREDVVPEYPDGFAELVVALNESMVGEESLEETLYRVAAVACQSSIGVDTAGVTLQRDGGPATAAFFGDVALEIDRAQYSADDGPCLVAYRTGEPQMLEQITDAQHRWPAFAAAAQDAGIVSSLSLPMTVRHETVGALNLYSSNAQRMTEEQLHLARLFAEQAAVAVMNADIYWKTYALTQNLTIALENREQIGQAKGILATRHTITLDDAFERMRRASQDLNLKLRRVADYVVMTGELPEAAGDLPDPDARPDRDA